MGFNEAWLSISGLSRDEVLLRMDLSESPDHIQGPETWAPRDGRACLAEFADGRWLLFSRDDPFQDESIAHLSEGATVVFGQVIDVVSFTACTFYENGRKLWRVEHNPDKQPRDVIIEGDLPERVKTLIEKNKTASIVERLDPYELPLKAAQMLGGYRPDEDMPMFDGLSIPVVETAKQARRREAKASRSGGFLSRLFGGK